MTFIQFENFDDAFAYMNRAAERAMQRATKEQRSLTWGSHFLRAANEGVLVFGRVMTEQELVQGEIDAGGSRDEALSSLETITASLRKGYLYGYCYSTWEPQGELGSTHLVHAWPISADEFRMADVCGWNPQEILAREGGEWLHHRLIDMSKALHS